MQRDPIHYQSRAEWQRALIRDALERRMARLERERHEREQHDALPTEPQTAQAAD